MALAAFANVEIVTLLLISYTLVFGLRQAFMTSLIFVTIEMLIWGFAIWVLLYYIYWPLMVLLVSMVRKLKFSVIYAAIIGIVMTVFFGALSTFLEVLVMSPKEGAEFAEFYIIRYISGIPLFLTHVICNSVTMTVLLYPVTRAIKRISRSAV